MPVSTRRTRYSQEDTDRDPPLGGASSVPVLQDANLSGHPPSPGAGTAPGPAAPRAPAFLPADSAERLFQPPTFKGGKLRDSGRALAFLLDVKRYFSAVRYYSATGPEQWDRRCTCLQLRCFPEDSYARAWFMSVVHTFVTFTQFEAQFSEHFVAQGADLVSVQSQWCGARQRKGDTVTQYYQHLLQLMAQLGQLGHVVSEHEIVARFVDGLHDDMRVRITARRIEQVSLDRHQLVNLASTFETADRIMRSSKPALHAFQAKPSFKRCWFCKKPGHTADTCRKIAARKAAGTWKESPPKSSVQS